MHRRSTAIGAAENEEAAADPGFAEIEGEQRVVERAGGQVERTADVGAEQADLAGGAEPVDQADVAGDPQPVGLYRPRRQVLSAGDDALDPCAPGEEPAGDRRLAQPERGPASHAHRRRAITEDRRAAEVEIAADRAPVGVDPSLDPAPLEPERTDRGASEIDPAPERRPCEVQGHVTTEQGEVERVGDDATAQREAPIAGSDAQRADPLAVDGFGAEVQLLGLADRCGCEAVVVGHGARRGTRS